MNKEDFKDKFVCRSIRLKRYLYILGFEYISHFEDNEEYYIFDKTNEIEESVDFFYKIRKNSNYIHNKY